MKKISTSGGVSLLSFFLLLLFSCSPVSYGELTAPEETVDENFAEEASATWNEDQMTILFPAVSWARTYGYSFSDDDPIAGRTVFHEDDGSYTMIIRALPDPVNDEYSVTLYATSNNDGSGNWRELCTIENVEHARADIDSFAPDAYISERKEDSVVIHVTNDPADMVYKVIFSDGKETAEFDDAVFTVTGIGRGETALEVVHRYADETEYGRFGAELTVPAFEMEAAMSLEVQGSSLRLSGLPSGYTAVSIVNTDTGSVLATASNAGSTITFSSFEGFDSGLFRAEATNGKRKVISNTVAFTAPVTVSETDVMRQHYKVTIPVVEGIDTSLFSAEIIGAPQARLQVVLNEEGNEADLIVSNLSSDTAYSNGYILVDDHAIITIPEFRTDSFEGTYAYRSTVHSDKSMDAFIVEVRLAPASPTSKYYFYASPEDPFNTEKRDDMRISPLRDEGEPGYGSAIKYDGNTDYQRTYRWNNEKWNTSPFDPSTWQVESYIAEADSYEANVRSVTSLATAVTTSKYDLTEDSEGNAMIVFFNKITGGDNYAIAAGNAFIRQNSSPDVEKYGEDDAAYTFELKLEEGV